MNFSAKQTISAQIPVELALAVENLAAELDRSKSWVIKEALLSMLAERERRHQRVLTGLADVDAGRVVGHSDMVDFANRLKKA
ncbi:ribbon-helix-helix protein, CopG family [Salmonella enterica subsp. enterica serovar Newport]|uniref:Ribbon-helix-helix protein, CopG family n=1 Tax=Salmonella diarizonae TaxID=59204 RepID=A0A6C8Y5R5_SALDZ|nr:ribbon-helix-helix protein, CopG family [Salmonella enterica subsp. enterica serovar Newport]MIE72964.1 ribbon-helix-helix protein, CopG family [Salmonella enterica subsp. diarizonae]EHS5152880.1 ribbon-helix-helix protein, CopG family [Salmonella enterica subsp. enterica serovar Newport]EHV5816250.1 ribbon-helix-helix protein, CopG family [Salmonella enterica subsp. enterica serovar Newport]EIC3608423.1 ribbon-helix-helix protein, CopG family [Salmonella enterica subsp. enterica serovar New